LRSIGAMIEAGRPCLDIAQQLQAAESAVREAKKTFINDHLDHCLDQVVDSRTPKARRSIDEFRTIAKYL
jgi:DNA-binding FrmR family transcriptional regulator